MAASGRHPLRRLQADASGSIKTQCGTCLSPFRPKGAPDLPGPMDGGILAGRPRLATRLRACVPQRREGCASGYNDEPAVSTASAGWAAVAPEKRGQTTGSGLDPPLSGRAHRDCISCLDVATMRRRTAELGRRRRPQSKTFFGPREDPTGQPTNQPPPLGNSRRLPGPGPVPWRRKGAIGVENIEPRRLLRAL